MLKSIGLVDSIVVGNLYQMTYSNNYNIMFNK